jgi:hypothetical protein
MDAPLAYENVSSLSAIERNNQPGLNTKLVVQQLQQLGCAALHLFALHLVRTFSPALAPVGRAPQGRADVVGSRATGAHHSHALARLAPAASTPLSWSLMVLSQYRPTLALSI